MVERRPLLQLLSHLVLILGVIVVALPVYITFVASTRSTDEIIHPPMPMLPGAHAVENYRAALTGEVRAYAGSTPYVRWGNWPVVTVSLLLLAFARRRNTLS